MTTVYSLAEYTRNQSYMYVTHRPLFEAASQEARKSKILKINSLFLEFVLSSKRTI